MVLFRFLHRSTFLFARGVRRTANPTPPPPPPSSSSRLSLAEEDENQASIQEQFARLELQRLEEDAGKIPIESYSNEQDEEEDLPRASIDPSTTSIILFPGQGTQFVGMGYVLLFIFFSI